MPNSFKILGFIFCIAILLLAVVGFVKEGFLGGLSIVIGSLFVFGCLFGIIFLLYWVFTKAKTSLNNKYRDLPKTFDEVHNQVEIERPLPTSAKSLEISIPENDFNNHVEIPNHYRTLRLNILAYIHYEDTNGILTKRRITINCLSGYDQFYLEAFCHERKDKRTFKVSRIRQFVDIETAEVVTDFNSYLLDRFGDTPIGKITKAMDAFIDHTNVLVFMARADGFLRQKERFIIKDYLMYNTVMDLDLDMLDREIKNTYVSNKDFRLSLKRLAEMNADVKKDIIAGCEKILQSDRKIDEVEQGVFNHIKKELL